MKIENVNIKIDNKVYSENTIKVSEGTTFKDLQLLSKHFANQANGTNILHNAKVIIIDSDRLNSVNYLQHVFKYATDKKQSIVFIINSVDYENLAKEILAINHKLPLFTILVSKAGGKKLQEDLELYSKMFKSPTINDGNFENISNFIDMDNLITLDKVTSDLEEVNFEGKFNPEAIEELEKELEKETDLEKRSKLEGKLMVLQGKNVTIGLHSEDNAEFYILKSKMDDVIKHVRSCL